MALFDFNANGNIHRIPDTFTKPVGRISDGAFYGRFSYPGADQWNVTDKYGSIDVYIRTYKGFEKPIAEVKQYGPNAPTPPRIAKSKEFIQQWVGTQTEVFKTLSDLGTRVASSAELVALGTADGQLIPLPATGLPINWQVDDNGYLKPYVEVTDPNDPLKKLAAQQETLLSNLFSKMDANATATGGATTGAAMSGNLTKYLRWAGIALGIAAAVAIVIVIFRAVSK